MLPAPSTTAISTPRSCTRLELVGDRPDRLRVGAVVERAHEGLARQLDQDPLEDGLVRHAPTAKRAKRRITTFSPVVPERFARSSSIVLPSYLSGLTCAWLSSTTSSIQP